MRCSACLIALAALCFCPITARAQFFGGAAIFEPEIDVVNTGVVMDAQATVSADRKYVTLTMRTQQSQLLSLQTFQFQSVSGGGGIVPPPGGIVGGVNPVIAGSNASAIPQRLNAPMKVHAGNGGAILLTRGITPLIAGE
jgi:hypothetical protein